MINNKIPIGLSYDDVLLVPQHSSINSRSEVDLSTQIPPSVRLKIPLISINMSDVTGVKMAVALGKLGGISFLPRFIPPEEEAEMVNQVKKKNVKVGAAIGIKDGEIDRADMLVKAGSDIITVDVAHAAMQKAIDTTKLLKGRYGNKVDIISGVVATYEGAYDLFKAGADSVRVGVGPGTICTTRIVTGVGVPQITALLETTRAAKKFNRTILCDGGTKSHGDIMKGIAAGASGVIIGSQFAGCDETPSKIIYKNGMKLKVYNASTSSTEKNNHIKNGVANGKDYSKHIEGVESYVPYRGPLSRTIQLMCASLRAGLSYTGSRNILELWEKSKFIRVTSLGIQENDAHGVIVNGQH